VPSYARCVAIVPDLDADGIDDFLLGGAKGYDVVSATSGRCLRRVIEKRYAEDARLTVRGLDGTLGCWLGADVDGDGERDLVSVELNCDRIDIAATSTRSFDVLWRVEERTETFLNAIQGAALQSLDVDGDNREELLLALPNEEVQGLVLVIDARDGRVRERREVSTGPDGNRGVTNWHDAALLVLPDQDGDGIDDYAVGVPGPAFADRDGDSVDDYVGGTGFTAAVALYSGVSGVELRRIEGDVCSEIGVDLAWLSTPLGGSLAIVGVDDGLWHGTNEDNGSLRLWDPHEPVVTWTLLETELAHLLRE
jgi:hypothetical protein